MDNEALARRLMQMSLETGSLNCLGCGYENNCSIHGCAVLKQAAEALERASYYEKVLADFAKVVNAGFQAMVEQKEKPKWIVKEWIPEPAADVEPVRHAYWVPEEHEDQVSPPTIHRYTWYYCSECGRRLIGYKNPIDAPYCHCGAKMDGGEHE